MKIVEKSERIFLTFLFTYTHTHIAVMRTIVQHVNNGYEKDQQTKNSRYFTDWSNVPAVHFCFYFTECAIQIS